MKPEERDAAYFWDMLNAAREISSFIQGKTVADYLRDKMLQAAIERKMEIIGEAARRMSPMSKESYPDIRWRSIIARRNILAHEYDEVRREILWKAATIHTPALIAQLTPIVESRSDFE